MGSNSSKQTAADTLLEITPRRRHEQPIEPELTNTTLHQALQNVAQYLRSSKAQITIIAVGGAINTLLLKTRTTTHDLDFFDHNLRKDELQLMTRAAKYAQSKDSNLPDEWLNNRTVLFIRREIRAELTQASIELNEAVFDEPGLRVLAAPWPYALCAKLDRIAGSMGLIAGKEYDIDDAVAYLHRYLTIKRKRSMTRSEILKWTAHYGTRINDGVLDQLNGEFNRRHGWVPMVG